MHKYVTSAGYMCLFFYILPEQYEAMPSAAIFRFVMTIKCNRNVVMYHGKSDLVSQFRKQS